MDIAAIATSLVAAQAARVQFAAAAKILRMNAQADAAVAQLLEAGQKNLNRLANVAAGIGTKIDVTA